MKKLMIAAFAVAFAAVAQAASVNWGGAIATPEDADAPLAAGQVAVLLFSESAFLGEAMSIADLNVGTIADNGGKIVSTWTLTEANVSEDYAFGASWNRGSDKDVNGFYAILIGNEEGKLASYMDMGEVSGTIPTSSATYVMLNADWSTGDYLTQGGYSVSVGAIPEPTSGLLLLIGMAGLALKRKQA